MTSTTTPHELDADGAEAVLAAALARAEESGARVVVTVVDRFGHVLGLRRTPGAQRASDAVSTAKARTAAIFVRPSRRSRSRSAPGG
jgi:uncharacterized protein GlcG (DUF336 family)